jgi:hypothetical protein
VATPSTTSKYSATKVGARYLDDIRESVGSNADVLERPQAEVVALGIKACELLDERNPPQVVAGLI